MGTLELDENVTSEHSFTLPFADQRLQVVTQCLLRCEQCERCRFVSVSTIFRDCTWHAHHAQRLAISSLHVYGSLKLLICNAVCLCAEAGSTTT